MRFATIVVDGHPTAVVWVNQPAAGWLPLRSVSPNWGELFNLIRSRISPGALADLVGRSIGTSTNEIWSWSRAQFAPPYRCPGKILGIGLNYASHALELQEAVPKEPASFFKAIHTIIGDGDDILLPRDVGRVTAEGELGIVIGRRCERVSVERALDFVFGFCPVLDQTAEDVLRRNPRFLTRAKNFETFLSFGPEVVSLDEMVSEWGTLANTPVRTVSSNGMVCEDVVGGMTFSPAELISFHSHIMPLEAGDIILSGTPGAVPLSEGDAVRCEVGRLRPLRNKARLKS